MKDLQPQIVWNHFYRNHSDSASIQKKEKIRAYLQEFGKKNNLPTRTDEAVMY